MWKELLVVLCLCCAAVRGQGTTAHGASELPQTSTETLTSSEPSPVTEGTVVEVAITIARHGAPSTTVATSSDTQSSTTTDGQAVNEGLSTTVIGGATATPTASVQDMSSETSSMEQTTLQTTTEDSAATSPVTKEISSSHQPTSEVVETTVPTSQVSSGQAIEMAPSMTMTAPPAATELPTTTPTMEASTGTVTVAQSEGTTVAISGQDGNETEAMTLTTMAGDGTTVDDVPRATVPTTEMSTQSEMAAEITTMTNSTESETSTTAMPMTMEPITLPPTTPEENATVINKTREEKQLSLDPATGSECSCDGSSEMLNSAMCPGRRVISHSDCSCQMTCARQANEACSSSSPCDTEFGLHCDLDTRMCTGRLAARVLDVTPFSISVGWIGSESGDPPVRVSISSVYSGPETTWTEVEAVKTSALFENLQPNTEYFVKVAGSNSQEIILARTADNPAPNIPRVLVTMRSPTSLNIVWDDFKMANSQAGYVVEYRMAGSDVTQDSASWRQVQASSLPMVTLSQLKPNTAYEIRVVVWEDQEAKKPWQVSEVVTAYTEDGCVWGNQSYLVGQQFSEGCDLTCICRGNDMSDCRDRCRPPYYTAGRNRADPSCYELPSVEDPNCCVELRCTEENEASVSDEGNVTEGAMEVNGKTTLMPTTEEVRETTTPDEGTTTTTIPTVTVIAEMGSTNEPSKTPAINETTPAAVVTDHTAMDATEQTTVTEGMLTMGMLDITLSTEVTSSPPTTAAPIITVPPTTAAPTPAPTTPAPSSSTEATTTVLSTVTEGLEKEVSTVQTVMDSPTTTIPVDMPTTIQEEPLATTPVTEDSTDEAPGAVTRFMGCEYHNFSYDIGERFEDGCESLCVCDGPGHVSCVPRCPIMAAPEGNCKEVPDPQDPCCFFMECSVLGDGSGVDIDALPVKIEAAEAQNATVVRVRTMLVAMENSTASLESPLQIWYAKADNDSDSGSIDWLKKVLDVSDLNMTETNYVDIDLDGLNANTNYYVKIGIARKSERMPKHGEGRPLIFSNTVNVRTFPAAVQTVFRGCFRHNRSYDVGEVFYEGCEHKCVCREGGLVECQDRCNVYIDTIGYEGCDWKPSEVDPCCIVPYCDNRDERMHGGHPERFCVTDHGDVRQVGDMWEAKPGCRRKVCKCESLRNGSTVIECNGGCPLMPPNAHLPTPECPRPELVIPDDPCLCPYVVCTRTPSHAMVPLPMCNFKGHQIEIGKEFHDGCRALCHCGQDLQVNCATIECPYHFDSRHSECLEWDIDPTFVPAPPHCCAPAECKNDGSCNFQGHLFKNFQTIPSKLLDCGTQCDCINGNVTCENLCPPIGEVPPPNLPCPPHLVHKSHAPGDSCCLRWLCREPEKRGQELHNVNIIAVNSTTVRVRFSLPSIFVGLIGHAELHFTSDPTLPSRDWHLQKFSRPNRVFDSANIEYYLDGLRPDTSYFMQIKTVIDSLHGGPESDLYKLRMPPAATVPPTTTTTTTPLPPLMHVDPMTHVEPLDSNTVRVVWRAFDPKEKQLIYGVQLKYKKTTQSDNEWVTTPMIHRDVTSYVIHNLDPASSYNVDLIFVTPEGMATRLESVKAAEVRTEDVPKDVYDFQVSLRQNSIGPHSFEMSVQGIPEPVSKYVTVVKVIYRSDANGGHDSVFKVPKADKIALDHLEPSTKYKVRLELYLTNGKTLSTNEVEFQTKPAPPEDNIIEPQPSKGKLVEALPSHLREAENKAYFVALIVVAVVAAVAAFGFVLLLVLLVRRQASAKAPISRTPSNSAYDNPSYKTYDGERTDDKSPSEP